MSAPLWLDIGHERLRLAEGKPKTPMAVPETEALVGFL